MALHRYEVIDQYTLPELTQEYSESTVDARIQLLQKVRPIPFELASLAAHDSSSRVRRWIARNADRLDYMERDKKDDSRNLFDLLKQDRDPIVRASLFENEVFGFTLVDKEAFRNASHLERLAMVRNPFVSLVIIENIFDPDDKSLPLSFEQRKDLALAYLTNPNVSEGNRPENDTSVPPSFDGAFIYQHKRRLCEYVLKWPKNSFPLDYFFRVIDADDSTKTRFYLSIDEPKFRRVLLMNCTDSDSKVLRLGMKDSDGECRTIAFSKIAHWPFGIKSTDEGTGMISDSEIETVLNSDDRDAIWGLASNDHLPEETLREAQRRLEALSAGISMAELVNGTLDRRRLKTIKYDGEYLFSGKCEGQKFLQHKINLIGRKILALEGFLTSGEAGDFREKLDNMETNVSEIRERLNYIWAAIIITLILLVIFRLFK